MKFTDTLLAAFLLHGLFAYGVRPASAQGALPDGPGKEIIQEACSVCHAVSMITEMRRSIADWKDTVEDMVSRGAPLMEGERETIIQYLAKNFGPDSAKVNINRAAAKELATALALSAKEAEEIVRVREQQGSFREWDDLKKVPGLDLQKLEAKKNRVSF